MLASGPAARGEGFDSPFTPENLEFFERRIRPILVEHCYECHSEHAKILEGGLRLDSAAHLRQGGDSGPAIEAGRPQKSLLLRALRYESLEMPPGGKLPENVIADFEHWIGGGAPDPRQDHLKPSSRGERTDQDTGLHWAFRRPVRVGPTMDEESNWARTEVDRFVLARLQEVGLAPSNDAPPRTLLRRVYYDLIGMPPTAAELASFTANAGDQAYQSVVDRLLASPHFGERWARHWLDIARYADTKGYVFTEDRNYPHAYKYRDWVIASFNRDMPYRDFLIAQLAADQGNDPSVFPAMGFLTLGRRFLNNKHDIIDDRIDVMTRGLLGLTVSCARCHDHKYDAISTADYYSLYGVFASSEEKPQDDGPPILVDAEQSIEPVIFLRGNPRNRGPQTPRRFLTCLSSVARKEFQHGSGRMEMAAAIASHRNPLTARVWVNRVWAKLTGRGIVSTTSNFGVRGAAPTHPELLDCLALTFMDEDWSTKRIIRRIVLSSVYRQASDERHDAAMTDPENELLWRMNRRRLDLEACRDSLLMASGQLNLQIGGPSVQLTEMPFATRRAVYAFVERQNLPSFFRTFDFANPGTHSPARPNTVSPQQALFFLNSPFVMQQACALAVRCSTECDSPTENKSNQRQTDEARISQLFRHALGRDPCAQELVDAREFLSVEASPGDDVRLPTQVWQYGWGAYDSASGKVQFHALPHFTGEAWQGGSELPDPALGWVSLHVNGGHPGDLSRQAIRRWIAPIDGQLRITGKLVHSSDKGDGVRARIVGSRQGLLDQWEIADGSSATRTSPVQIKCGDSVDFIVDCRKSESHDSFEWNVTLRVEQESKHGESKWTSAKGFQGPLPSPLDRWEQLAQVLLMSNEFLFVD